MRPAVYTPDAGYDDGGALERELIAGRVDFQADSWRDEAGVNAPLLRQADGLLVWHQIALDASAIGRLEKCRVIVRAGVGFNNIDIAAAAARGIPVCNTPDYGTAEVADHALALLRRNYGETTDNLAGSYWMAGNFRKYGGHWNDLPVDAHELIALVAPRPIFITGATQDPWSDPHGEFLAAVAAGPVYRLLGRKGLGTAAMPPPNVALTSGDIAFREHAGAHTDVPDWPVFIEYASRYLTRPN